jgi:hypothetical protein
VAIEVVVRETMARIGFVCAEIERLTGIPLVRLHTFKVPSVPPEYIAERSAASPTAVTSLTCALAIVTTAAKVRLWKRVSDPLVLPVRKRVALIFNAKDVT